MAGESTELVWDSPCVPEADELSTLVQHVIDGCEDKQATYTRFRSILEKYQESPHLLDPHLPSLITKLAEELRSSATDDAKRKESLSETHESIYISGRLLWVIASVRGSKTIVKYFPHSAYDLEPVMELLDVVNAKAIDWESQCVVFLWLSQLITLPFHLAVLDSSLSDGSLEERDAYPPMVGRLLEISKQHLHLPGSSRDMAAHLLGRLLTRPDTTAALEEFLDWGMAAVMSSNQQNVFLVPGVLRAVATVIQVSQRKALVPLLPQLLSTAIALPRSKLAANSVLTRKLAMKLIQRVGLVMLPPRHTSWSLLQQPKPLMGIPNRQANSAGEVDADEEVQLEVPEEMEEIVDVLLQGLRDQDTIVRWSAAKGLGRITARLTKELGDEVVEQVVDLLKDTHSDTAWHGACLTLAELARKGLLLLPRLTSITPLVTAALQFDLRRGAHSVGAHVRDAAAYICWAFARAYPAQAVASIVHMLAPALLTTACYDREVNCRRAASAAFQESVGRQGNYPHALDLVQAADYFTLSSRSHAYLQVAPFIAGFQEYGPAMRQHLLLVKLQHWEQSLRELTSQALAALVPTDAHFFSTSALETLLPLCTNSTLEIRHGAILGVAEILLACCEHKIDIQQHIRQAIADRPSQIVQAKLVRGRGGELLRTAICRFIQCASLAHLQLTSEQVNSYRTLLDECLRHSSPPIQSQAVAAFCNFCRSYLQNRKDVRDITHVYVQELRDPVSAVRCGCASALGALPYRLLHTSAEAALTELVEATQVSEGAGDVETRVAAVKAIGAACTTLLQGPEEHDMAASNSGAVLRRSAAYQRIGAARSDTGSGTSCESEGPTAAGLRCFVRIKVLPALLEAMQDYSTDNRGDVGSWVRLATMEALVQLLQGLLQAPDGMTSDLSSLEASVQAVISAMLQQSVERITRMREASLTQLQKLLIAIPAELGIASHQQLDAIVKSSLKSPSSLEVVKMVSQLLEVPAYRGALLEGLVYSIGGMDASLAEATASSLLQQEKAGQLDAICRSLLERWKPKQNSARLSSAFLKTASVLLSAKIPPGNHPLMSDLSGDLLEAVEGEVRGCKDLGRLCAAATVLCRLLSCGIPTRMAALRLLTALLACRFPRVRKEVAEQLYLQLLGEESDEDLEEVTDVLLSTSWAGSVVEAKQAQKKIRNAFGLT